MQSVTGQKYKKSEKSNKTPIILNYQKSLKGEIGPCDTYDYNFQTRPYLYAILKPIVKILLRIGWNFKVIGKENIPKHTNVVFMPNHMSHFDSFLVGSYFPTTPVGIADEKLFRNKLFYLFARNINAFPVRKGTKSLDIVEYAIARIKRGDSMLWFPEGQRNKKPRSNKMMPGKLGSGMLAHGVNVPIIPVFIEGAEFAMPIGGKLTIGKGPRSIKITVRFGKPVYLDDLRKLPRSKETSKKVLDRIMNAIEELRPPGPYMIQKV